MRTGTGGGLWKERGSGGRPWNLCIPPEKVGGIFTPPQAPDSPSSQSLPASIINRAAAAGVREKDGERNNILLSHLPSFLNKGQWAGWMVCGEVIHRRAEDVWHLSLQRFTRWSRSKSSSPCYKYNGKQADTGNNKRQHMPWSTSVGRKECYSSMLCISALNSSMKALSLARTTA